MEESGGSSSSELSEKEDSEKGISAVQCPSVAATVTLDGLATIVGRAEDQPPPRFTFLRRLFTCGVILVHLALFPVVRRAAEAVGRSPWAWHGATTVLLSCWLVFECLRTDSSPMCVQAGGSLFLEYLVAISADVFVLFPTEPCNSAGFLAQTAMTFGLLLIRNMLSIGALTCRTQLVEDAFGRPLAAKALRVLRIMLVPSFLVWLGVSLAILVSNSPCDSDEALHRFFRFGVNRVVLASWMAVWVCTTALVSWSFWTVSHVLEKTESAFTGSYARAEATWALSIIRRYGLASLIFSVNIVILGVVSMISMDIAEEEMIKSYFLRVRCCLYSLVDLFCLLVIVGFFQPVRPDLSFGQSRPRSLNMSADRSESCNAVWRAKVEDLASRSISVKELLDFFSRLGSQAVMPHWDPTLHTTNDVVRSAIIPLSRVGSSGQAYAVAALGPSGRTMPQCLVTHDWQNLFVNLVSAVVADALGTDEYKQIAEALSKGQTSSLHRVQKELYQAGTENQRYWICALCVNQHASICGGFGEPPAVGTTEHVRWSACCRDTATGSSHSLCDCKHPKYFNSSDECELNKFDDMMHFLQGRVPGFRQLVAADPNFDTFMRLWCVAELVEAHLSGMPQSVCIMCTETLQDDGEALTIYCKLANLTVAKCTATRIEDKEIILAKIPDMEEFDAQVQALIFGEWGILRGQLVGSDVLYAAGRVARRVQGALS